MPRLRVTIPYPKGKVSDKGLEVLLSLESIRQHMFDIFTKYAEDSYMKYTVVADITGDTYQSRSALVLTPRSGLNNTEAIAALEFLGANVTVLAAENESWKVRIDELKKKKS